MGLPLSSLVEVSLETGMEFSIQNLERDLLKHRNAYPLFTVRFSVSFLQTQLVALFCVFVSNGVHLWRLVGNSVKLVIVDPRPSFLFHLLAVTPMYL